MTTTTTNKPRWVEVADRAADVLEAARQTDSSEDRDSVVREAHAWMQLACVYRDGQERNLGTT